MKNPDLSVKILLQKCLTVIKEKLVRENQYKIVCLYLLHQIKAQQFYTDLDLYQHTVLQKIEEFKDFSWHLSDFPVLFKAYLIFQGLFKKAL